MSTNKLETIKKLKVSIDCMTLNREVLSLKTRILRLKLLKMALKLKVAID
jgi:hypothetical protein